MGGHSNQPSPQARASAIFFSWTLKYWFEIFLIFKYRHLILQISPQYCLNGIPKFLCCIFISFSLKYIVFFFLLHGYFLRSVLFSLKIFVDNKIFKLLNFDLIPFWPLYWLKSFKIIKTHFWPRISSILLNILNALSINIYFSAIDKVFYKVGWVNLFDHVIQIFYILPDFLSILFINFWKKSIYIINHNWGLVYFSLISLTSFCSMCFKTILNASAFRIVISSWWIGHYTIIK